MFKIGKKEIFILLIIFLPLTVYIATSSNNHDSRSRAVSTVVDGGLSNVIVTGVNSESKRTLVLSTVAKTAYTPKIKTTLSNDIIEFKNRPQQKELAYTNSKTLISLYDIEKRGNDDTWRFIISHELFHMLYFRNEGFIRDYPFEELIVSDKNCFRNTTNGKVIKSYAITPRRAKTESFAESGALYVWNKSPLKPQAFINFRAECPNSYKWFKDNIFN